MTKRNKPVVWTESMERVVREEYKTLGPTKLAKKLNVSHNAVVWKAQQMGLKTDKFFEWTPERVELLKENYNKIGPVKTAALLGTTLASVTCKARRLGIREKREIIAYEWTEKQLKRLKELYATADRETLEREIGLPNYAIRYKARVLGLKSEVHYELSGAARAARNKSCNIHFFDEWNERSAYVFGFCLADGSITKRGGDVVIGLAEQDVCILDYIKEVTESTRDFYKRKPPPKDGYQRQMAVFLTLSSKIMVAKLAELGLKQRKTYNDDPFPNVPDAVMPHFIRGYFDGDGSAVRTCENRCLARFIGSPRVMEGLRDTLVRMAGMSHKEVKLDPDTVTPCSRITWGAEEDIRKFRDFIYPEGYEFCLERKKAVFDKWLSERELRWFKPKPHEG